MKTSLKKLVISQELSRELLELGLQNIAALYYTEEGTITTDTEQASSPAWTMEELRIMIGNNYVAPDLPIPRPKPNDGEDITFFLHTIDRGYQFKSGAEASGTMLKMMLQERASKPEEVNERYNRKFKPEQSK